MPNYNWNSFNWWGAPPISSGKQLKSLWVLSDGKNILTALATGQERQKEVTPQWRKRAAWRLTVPQCGLLPHLPLSSPLCHGSQSCEKTHYRPKGWWGYNGVSSEMWLSLTHIHLQVACSLQHRAHTVKHIYFCVCFHIFQIMHQKASTHFPLCSQIVLVLRLLVFWKQLFSHQPTSDIKSLQMWVCFLTSLVISSWKQTVMVSSTNSHSQISLVGTVFVAWQQLAYWRFREDKLGSIRASLIADLFKGKWPRSALDSLALAWVTIWGQTALQPIPHLQDSHKQQ